MKERILFAILNWGLGHATRCVPLIEKEIRAGNEVVLSSDGAAGKLLRSRYPNLSFIELPSYSVVYPTHIPLGLSILFQIPRILRAIRGENTFIRNLQKEWSFDRIISDNRYGAYHPDLPSIFITHQVFPIVPGPLKPLVHHFIHKNLRAFREIWIPDYPDYPGLSGKLSHGNSGLPVEYIGPLSRFSLPVKHISVLDEWPHILAIISGPEPQRTRFQELLVRQFMHEDCIVWIIAGTPGSTTESTVPHIRIRPDLTDDLMRTAIQKAHTIICRPGYSSLMDLIQLGREAILVPTPGQTEQEYLAGHFQSTFGWMTISQDKLAHSSIGITDH